MTLDRGDSPLAGRRPAPLSSVAGLGAMNSMSPMGSVGSVHTQTSATSLGSIGQISTMGSSNMGPSSIGSSNIGSMGSIGNSGSGSPGTSAPPGNASVPSAASMETRNSSSFWLELKGVERWYDQLEPHERMTLMTSLSSRTPEAQLHQFSSTIDKALRNQPATANLSRFGVRHNQPSASDINNVYKYRSPLSAGAGTGSAVPSAVSASSPTQNTVPHSAVPHSSVSHTAGNGRVNKTSTSGNVTSGSVAPGSIPSGNAAAATNIGSGTNSVPGASNTSIASRTGPAGTGQTSSHTAEGVNSKPAPSSASATSGFVSPLSFSSSSSHASDLYTHAFLPLPRAQGYSPWGTEIRRPSSAAADAWPDTTRNSPTLQSASNHGSPNISSLSLETPPPFPSGQISSSTASASASQSPIGHPLKPWRTFTPHHNPIDAGIGQAPDSSSMMRTSTLPASSPSSPSTGPIGSTPAPVGSAPVGSSPVTQAPQSAIGAGGVAASTGKINGVEGSGSVSSSRAGSLTPKDNRLARRSVNVVDVELLSDIGAWLRSLRLHKYTGNLSGMRWQDVIHLDDKDLEDRGVNALGARRKLLKMFEEIRIAQEAGQLPEQ